MGYSEVMTQSIPVSQARQKLGELVNEVYKRHVRIVVEKSGIPVVALVALSDFERWIRVDREQERVDATAGEMSMNKKRMSSSPPTEEELAHRQAVVAKVLANADKRVVSPVTSADLVQMARQERDEAYERWTH